GLVSFSLVYYPTATAIKIQIWKTMYKHHQYNLQEKRNTHHKHYYKILPLFRQVKKPEGVLCYYIALALIEYKTYNCMLIIRSFLSTQLEIIVLRFDTVVRGTPARKCWTAVFFSQGSNTIV
ncbi:hypothetical protein ACJX0J_036496, partial [Zea mays]